jgi:hypothetical protein
MRPQRKPRNSSDSIDLRDADLGSDGANGGRDARVAEVRAVLESAADVIFSDGISAEFLDQWTFETVQLLEQREARTQRPRRTRRPVSAGR